MKKLFTWALAIALLAGTSSVFAMEPMDDTMMMKKDDTMMMKNTMMMKKDTMMKKNKTAASLARHYGYNWSTDRSMLATMAGIEGYRGTRYQNMIIKAYLMKSNMMKGQ
jgi:hypothetical protein